MAHFKYKDGQVHEYLDPKDIEFLSNHPDFTPFEKPVVEDKPKPVRKKE